MNNIEYPIVYTILKFPIKKRWSSFNANSGMIPQGNPIWWPCYTEATNMLFVNYSWIIMYNPIEITSFN